MPVIAVISVILNQQDFVSVKLISPQDYFSLEDFSLKVNLGLRLHSIVRRVDLVVSDSSNSVSERSVSA